VGGIFPYEKIKMEKFTDDRQKDERAQVMTKFYILDQQKITTTQEIFVSD
jgi:hypothetical protein